MTSNGVIQNKIFIIDAQIQSAGLSYMTNRMHLQYLDEQQQQLNLLYKLK